MPTFYTHNSQFRIAKCVEVNFLRITGIPQNTRATFPQSTDSVCLNLLHHTKHIQSNRHSRNSGHCSPRRRKVSPRSQERQTINEDNPNTVEKHGTTCVPSFHTFTWTKVRGRRTKNNKHTLRPSPNERTCMGWHERHASLRRGSRGILRPEALNLEA